MSGDAPVISIANVSKVYRSGLLRRREVRALDDVSFDVHRGEIFGLLGPNGAGKTTLVKILLGIVRRYRGSAQLLGEPAGKSRSRRRVGYLPENLRLRGYQSAHRALMLYGQLSGMPRAQVRARAKILLERVGLAKRARDGVRKFSKGMLQRLGLVLALLHDPDVIFLDEPTDGLDPVARADVRAWLEELKRQGKTVFINSHLLQEVELVCDRVAILHQGRLCAVGRVGELADALSPQIVVRVRLRGPRDAIQQVTGPMAETAKVYDEGSSAVVETTLPSQQEVNELVDRIRAAGLDLLELRRAEATLEDVFLKFIRQQDGAKVPARADAPPPGKPPA